MNERTCTRCQHALGDSTYKCPSCGQLNPTAGYWVGAVLAVAVVVIVFAVIIGAATS